MPHGDARRPSAAPPSTNPRSSIGDTGRRRRLSRSSFLLRVRVCAKASLAIVSFFLLCRATTRDHSREVRPANERSRSSLFSLRSFPYCYCLCLPFSACSGTFLSRERPLTSCHSKIKANRVAIISGVHTPRTRLIFSKI